MRARSLNSIGVCFNHESKNHRDEGECESHTSSTVFMRSRTLGSAASDLMSGARAYGRTTMAALHQPIESRCPTIARATPSPIFMNPARFAPSELSYPRTWNTASAKLVRRESRCDMETSRRDDVPEGSIDAHHAGQSGDCRSAGSLPPPHFFGGVAAANGKFFTRAYPASRSSVKEGFSNCGWRQGRRLPLQVSPSTISNSAMLKH